MTHPFFHNQHSDVSKKNTSKSGADSSGSKNNKDKKQQLYSLFKPVPLLKKKKTKHDVGSSSSSKEDVISGKMSITTGDDDDDDDNDEWEISLKSLKKKVGALSSSSLSSKEKQRKMVTTAATKKRKQQQVVSSKTTTKKATLSSFFTSSSTMTIEKNNKRNFEAEEMIEATIILKSSSNKNRKIKGGGETNNGRKRKITNMTNQRVLGGEDNDNNNTNYQVSSNPSQQQLEQEETDNAAIIDTLHEKEEKRQILNNDNDHEEEEEEETAPKQQKEQIHPIYNHYNRNNIAMKLLCRQMTAKMTIRDKRKLILSKTSSTSSTNNNNDAGNLSRQNSTSSTACSNDSVSQSHNNIARNENERSKRTSFKLASNVKLESAMMSAASSNNSSIQVTAMSYDYDGALLAVGTNHGQICIYEWDTLIVNDMKQRGYKQRLLSEKIQSQQQQEKQQEKKQQQQHPRQEDIQRERKEGTSGGESNNNEEEDKGDNNNNRNPPTQPNKPKTIATTLPALSSMKIKRKKITPSWTFMTSHIDRISNLKWNPTNHDELIVSYKSTCKICIYDIGLIVELLENHNKKQKRQRQQNNNTQPTRPFTIPASAYITLDPSSVIPNSKRLGVSSILVLPSSPLQQYQHMLVSHCNGGPVNLWKVPSIEIAAATTTTTTTTIVSKPKWIYYLDQTIGGYSSSTVLDMISIPCAAGESSSSSSSSNYILLGTSTSHIILLNWKDCTRKSFSTQPTPTILHVFDTYNTNNSGLTGSLPSRLWMGIQKLHINNNDDNNSNNLPSSFLLEEVGSSSSSRHHLPKKKKNKNMTVWGKHKLMWITSCGWQLSMILDPSLFLQKQQQKRRTGATSRIVDGNSVNSSRTNNKATIVRTTPKVTFYNENGLEISNNSSMTYSIPSDGSIPTYSSSITTGSGTLCWCQGPQLTTIIPSMSDKRVQVDINNIQIHNKRIGPTLFWIDNNSFYCGGNNNNNIKKMKNGHKGCKINEEEEEERCHSLELNYDNDALPQVIAMHPNREWFILAFGNRILLLNDRE